MQLDDAFRGKSGMLGNVVQIRAEFAAIVHWNFDRAGRFTVVLLRFRSHFPMDQPLDNRTFHQPRVELNQQRRISRMQVQNPADTFETASEMEDLMMRFEGDSRAERDKKRAVARRADGHFKVMVASPGGRMDRL